MAIYLLQIRGLLLSYTVGTEMAWVHHPPHCHGINHVLSLLILAEYEFCETAEKTTQTQKFSTGIFESTTGIQLVHHFCDSSCSLLKHGLKWW